MAVNVDTRAEAVERLAEIDDEGLYLLEDALDLVEPWDDEVAERVERRADTFLQKRAMPSGDADIEDEAVGAYEVAQILVKAEGGDKKSGDGAGAGFNARSAYRKNMDVLVDLVDGIDKDELNLVAPTSSD